MSVASYLTMEKWCFIPLTVARTLRWSCCGCCCHSCCCCCHSGCLRSSPRNSCLMQSTAGTWCYIQTPTTCIAGCYSAREHELWTWSDCQVQSWHQYHQYQDRWQHAERLRRSRWQRLWQGRRLRSSFCKLQVGKSSPDELCNLRHVSLSTTDKAGVAARKKGAR